MIYTTTVPCDLVSSKLTFLKKYTHTQSHKGYALRYAQPHSVLGMAHRLIYLLLRHHLRREHAGRGRGHGESCRSDGSAGGKRPEATWLRRSEGERSGSSALGAAGSLVKWGVGSGEVVQSQSRSRAKAV